MSPHKRADFILDTSAMRGQIVDGEIVSTTIFKDHMMPPSIATYQLTTSAVVVPDQAPVRAINPFGGARIENDPYCAVETYRGVKLRYVDDPARPGKVRVYVETPIDFRGRSSGAATTHLWPQGHDGPANQPPHLCLKAEHAPSTYEAAKGVAEQWVRGTQHYIATGEDISTALRNGKTL